MWKTEGVQSFYKGITPRVLRFAPGEAIVFAAYERARSIIENMIHPRAGEKLGENRLLQRNIIMIISSVHLEDLPVGQRFIYTIKIERNVVLAI